MEHHTEIQTAATVQHHTPPEKEAGGGSLLEIDGTLVFIAGSFVIFTLVMQQLFYGPLIRIREKRQNHLDSIKNAADKALEKAESLDVEYVEKIKDARKKVSENTASVLAEANSEKSKIIEERKQQVSEFLSANRQQIQEEKAKSLDDLSKNVIHYAADIYKKILDEDMSATVGDYSERSH